MNPTAHEALSKTCSYVNQPTCPMNQNCRVAPVLFMKLLYFAWKWTFPSPKKKCSQDSTFKKHFSNHKQSLTTCKKH